METCPHIQLIDRFLPIFLSKEKPKTIVLCMLLLTAVGQLIIPQTPLPFKQGVGSMIILRSLYPYY